MAKDVGSPKVDVKVTVNDGKEFTPRSYIMIFVDKVESNKDGTEVYMTRNVELPDSTSPQEIGTYIEAMLDISKDLSIEIASRLAMAANTVGELIKERKNAS